MQPDPQRAWIPVSLDRQRVLAFDNRATWLLMERYGPAFTSELYEKRGSGVHVKNLEAFEYFVWAGLQRDAREAGESLSIEQVQEFIRPMYVPELFRALLVAISWTFRRKEPGNASAAGEAGAPVAEPQSPKRGTGKRNRPSHTAR